MTRKIPVALLNAGDTITYLKKKIAQLETDLKPCNDKRESLYETIAFITHSVSSTEKYERLYIQIGEGMFGPLSLFILWAKEFEETNRHRQWGIDNGSEYIDELYVFIETKLNHELGLNKA